MNPRLVCDGCFCDMFAGRGRIDAGRRGVNLSLYRATSYISMWREFDQYVRQPTPELDFQEIFRMLWQVF